MSSVDPNPLSLAFLEDKPVAAAALLQDFSPEQAVEFLEHVPLDALIPVLGNMASWPAARALSLMQVELIAPILCGLPDVQAEALLRLMSAEQREAVMAELPRKIARSFTQKLAYPLSTVGAWMDTTVPCFEEDSSVEHCLDLVKRQQIHLGGIVIVVDERRHLVGLVELDELLTSDPHQKLLRIINTQVMPLSPRATLWEVEHHESWRHLPTLPVVDRNNLMLGALTHSALRSGMARTAKRRGDSHSSSIVLNLTRSMFVVASGLLQVLVAKGPEAAPLQHPAQGDDPGLPRWPAEDEHGN